MSGLGLGHNGPARLRSKSPGGGAQGRLAAMLILSRKVGQSFMIGDTIRVKVVARDRGEVKIGVEAPADVEVVRAELVGKAPPQKDSTTDHPRQP
jgi:carbon storage regulator